MIKKILALVAVIFLCAANIGYAEKAPDVIYNLAGGEIAALGTDSVIVDAIKEANSKNQTLDSIKLLDEQWQITPGLDAFMKSFMENACAAKIKSFKDSKPFYSEIFVMDNQGAIVAMTDKTSDYWQGDEAKFKKSYNKGNGAVFVDNVEFDDSTQVYLVQVSVPVKVDGRTIGVITVGIDVDVLSEK